MLFNSLAVFRRSVMIPSLRSFATKEAGTVKWFDVKKGFGFITPQDGGKDVFVHQTVIHANGFRSLAEGETVEYTVQHDDTGRLKATLVTGPMGAFVQGMPKPSFRSNNNNNDYGFGNTSTIRTDSSYHDDDDEWMRKDSPADYNDDDEPKSNDHSNKN